MPTVRLTVEERYSRKMARLLKLLNDREIKTYVNRIIAREIQPYVPMKEGGLRASLRVGENFISWGHGLNYARYQFGGEVYGANYPIVADGKLLGFFNTSSNKRYPIFDSNSGTITGWFSLPGVSKYPTGRKLGTPGKWRDWEFGYTTPGTQSHWTDVYEKKLRSKTNREITAYLKWVCRNRGLNT